MKIYHRDCVILSHIQNFAPRTSHILDLQPISRDSRDNVSHPRWLVPTIELIKYSFVLHYQHGRSASQEFLTFSQSLATHALNNVSRPR